MSVSLVDKSFADGRKRLKGLDFMNWPVRDAIRADPAGNMGIVPRVRNEPLVHEDMEGFFPLREAMGVALTSDEAEMISAVYLKGGSLKKVAAAWEIPVSVLKEKIEGALVKMRAVLEEPPVVKVKVKKDPAHYRMSGKFPLATKQIVTH